MKVSILNQLVFEKLKCFDRFQHRLLMSIIILLYTAIHVGNQITHTLNSHHLHLRQIQEGEL